MNRTTASLLVLLLSLPIATAGCTQPKHVSAPPRQPVTKSKDAPRSRGATGGDEDERAAKEIARLVKRSVMLLRAGRCPEAVEANRGAIRIIERLGDQAGPLYALLFHNVAQCYMRMDRYKLAEKSIRRALLLERRYRRDSPAFAQFLAVLGLVRAKLGDVRGAAGFLRHAIHLTRRKAGLAHPGAAFLQARLADIYLIAGDHKRGVALFDRALVNARRTAAPNSAILARLLLRRAYVHLRFGEAHKAIPMFEEALRMAPRIKTPALGAVDWLVAEADLRRAQKRFPEAQRLLERAVAAQEKRRGPRSFAVATVLQELGNVFRLQAQHARAVPHYLRALAIRDARLPKKHLGNHDILKALTDCYRALGQPDKAKPYRQRLKAIADSRRGPIP